MLKLNFVEFSEIGDIYSRISLWILFNFIYLECDIYLFRRYCEFYLILFI